MDSKFIAFVRGLTKDDLSDSDEEAPQIKRPKPSTSKKEEPKKVRKVRTKEEIAQENREKELQRIERENSCAKNAKCELYTFCHCSKTVLTLEPNLQQIIQSLFEERKIPSQISFKSMDHAKVYWTKKRVFGLVENNSVLRSEKDMVQFAFIVALDASSLKRLVDDSRHCEEFIENLLTEHTLLANNRDEPRLILAAIGNANTLDNKALKLFEKYRVQIRICQSSVDFAYFIAQMHRSLAKLEKKQENSTFALHVDVEKGIEEGSYLVKDWWTRMLSHIHRISEEALRAIVTRYPDPFALMDELETMDAGEAMNQLADIVCDSGRRMGPALAQKIFTMLMSEDGSEILERPA